MGSVLSLAETIMSYVRHEHNGDKGDMNNLPDIAPLRRQAHYEPLEDGE